MKTAIYIAGPMTGYENFNFPAFDHAEKYLRSMGYEDIGNPARWDRETYGNKIQENTRGDVTKAVIDTGFDLRKTLNKDLSWLCTTATDIFMMMGWENSKGARAEHATAVALGLGVQYQKGL